MKRRSWFRENPSPRHRVAAGRLTASLLARAALAVLIAVGALTVPGTARSDDPAYTPAHFGDNPLSHVQRTSSYPQMAADTTNRAAAMLRQGMDPDSVFSWIGEQRRALAAQSGDPATSEFGTSRVADGGFHRSGFRPDLARYSSGDGGTPIYRTEAGAELRPNTRFGNFLFHMNEAAPEMRAQGMTFMRQYLATGNRTMLQRAVVWLFAGMPFQRGSRFSAETLALAAVLAREGQTIGTPPAEVDFAAMLGGERAGFEALGDWGAPEPVAPSPSNAPVAEAMTEPGTEATTRSVPLWRAQAERGPSNLNLTNIVRLGNARIPYTPSIGGALMGLSFALHASKYGVIPSTVSAGVGVLAWEVGTRATIELAGLVAGRIGTKVATRAIPVIGEALLVADVALFITNRIVGAEATWGDVWNYYTGQLDKPTYLAGPPPPPDQNFYYE